MDYVFVQDYKSGHTYIVLADSIRDRRVSAMRVLGRWVRHRRINMRAKTWLVMVWLMWKF